MVSPLWEVDVTVTGGTDLPPVRLNGTCATPSAGVALAVLDAARTGDAETLRAAAQGWLPPRLWSEVRPLSDGALGSVLITFVALSAGRRTRTGDPDEDIPTPSASRSVLRVARAYGWTRDSALAMPWPDYLNAAEALPELEAADTLRQMAASNPSKETVAHYVELANGKREVAGSSTPWKAAGVSEQEHRRSVLQEIHRVRTNQSPAEEA